MSQQDLPALRRARQLWASEHHEEAIALFAECAAAHPTNPFALTDAARVYGQWFDFDRMEDYLQKLLRLSSRRPENGLQAGMTYRMNYRPEKAVYHLQRAASSRRTAFLGALELAVLSERHGDLDQARDSAQQALRESPGNPEAAVVLARVLTRGKETDEAERLLAGVTAQRGADISPDTLATALALRARIHEKQGQYKDAYSLAAKSKETMRPLAKGLHGEVRQKSGEISQLFDNLTPEHVEQILAWRPPEGTARLCLMTSYPRSGTTLLASMLGAHLEVEAGDELPVFSVRLANPLIAECGGTPADAPDRFLSFADERLADYRATYLGCHAQALDTTLDDKLLLDKNPSVTVFVPFFVRLFPEIKLLVPLRDPRDVILSCFFQYLPINATSVSFLDLETAAKSYAKIMGHWVQLRRTLPEDRWQEVQYEDLVSSPESELRRVLEFLGLPWHDGTMSYHPNPNVIVHNAPTYADVRQPPHRKAVGRWEKYADHFVPLRPVLEPIMRQLGYTW